MAVSLNYENFALRPLFSRLSSYWCSDRHEFGIRFRATVNPSLGVRRQHPTAMDGGSVENAGAIHRPCCRRYTEANTKLTSSD